MNLYDKAFSSVETKQQVTYRFLNAIRHNDANKMTPPPPTTDSLLKPVLNIFILRNSIVGWGRVLSKRELISFIKSIDLGEVLIVGGVGFIKVRVGII